MNPKGAKLQPKLTLAMPFAEALQRFSSVSPDKLPRRKGGVKRKPRKQNGSLTDSGDAN